MTLDELFITIATDLENVVSSPVAGSSGREWRRGSLPFATLTGGRAEFRLPGLVGRAALGTPDTHPSDRGADWIAFLPSELDGMALDRAAAWFENAWRHAGD